MTQEIVVTPHGHSLETPEANLAGKLHIVFHGMTSAGTEVNYTFILTKDQYEQLAQDIIDYGT